MPIHTLSELRARGIQHSRDAFARLEAEANEAATGRNHRPLPTEAQQIAGNYKKGPVSLHGLRLKIENVRNSERSGTAPDGTKWTSRMGAHYGYFAGTRGADGDEVDVFVGPFPESDRVWVINQRKVHGEAGFDEHKVMLGFHTEDQARSAYERSFSPGWQGLDTIVPVSVSQLKWWLRMGNTSRALTPEQLPHEGPVLMDAIAWTAEALPSLPLHQLLYAMRREDAEDGLLLDAADIEDHMTDPEIDERMTLDALVVEVGRLKPRMDAILRVMTSTGDKVKPTGFTIADPVKSRGVLQVLVLFTMSDGQTVGIWFHNPDTTPAKLTPMDELISWKWMLNKRDVTIVVAPEKGIELNVQEVSRRVMRLVERNSEGFQKANAKAAELAAAHAALDSEIGALEVRLGEVTQQVDLKRAERTAAAAVAAAEEPAPNVEPPAPEPEAPAAWRAEGFDPTTAEAYAVVRASRDAQLYWQDRLDAFFQGRIIAVRNALRERGWGGENLGPLSRGDASLDLHADKVGGGGNVVGTTWIVKTGERETSVVDDLTKSADEVAAQINEAGAPLAALTQTQDPDAGGDRAAAPIVINGDELGEFPDTPEGLKDLRAAARGFLSALRGQWIDCAALSRKVEIRRRSIKEMMAFSGNPKKLKLIPAIVQIIGTATNAQREANNDPASKRNVLAYYRLHNTVQLAGESVPVQVIVEEDDKGLLHYDFLVSKDLKKQSAVLDSSHTADAPGSILNDDSRDAGEEIVDDAAAGVNRAEEPAADLALDDIGHAVASLEVALSVVQTNEPINRARGDIEQADLERDVAESVVEALEVLKAYERAADGAQQVLDAVAGGRLTLNLFIAGEQEEMVAPVRRVTKKAATAAYDDLSYRVQSLQGHTNVELLRVDVAASLEPLMLAVRALVERGWPEGVVDPAGLLERAQDLIARWNRLKAEGITGELGRGEAWTYLVGKGLSGEQATAALLVPTRTQFSGEIEQPLYSVQDLDERAAAALQPAPAPEPEPVHDEPAEVGQLRAIASGERDGADLGQLLDDIEAAVTALQAAGSLTPEADQIACDAITRWATLDEKANG